MHTAITNTLKITGSALVSVLVLPSILVIYARRAERPAVEEPMGIPLAGTSESGA